MQAKVQAVETQKEEVKKERRQKAYEVPI